MPSANFVAEYIQECIQQGVQNPPEMRSRAEKEINEIEEELRKISALRERQKNLRAVIKNLGGFNRARPEKVMDFTTPEKDLSPEFRSLCVKICEEVEKSVPQGVPASRVIHEITTVKEHKSGYSAVKWLGTRGIIKRDENRLIIPGPQWEDRPIAYHSE